VVHCAILPDRRNLSGSRSLGQATLSGAEGTRASWIPPEAGWPRLPEKHWYGR